MITTPEEIARQMHEAARKIAWRAENARQADAKDRLIDDETEPAECCEDQALTGLMLRGKSPELKSWYQIRRLHPNGRVTVCTVRFCPFCGRRFRPEAAE